MTFSSWRIPTKPPVRPTNLSNRLTADGLHFSGKSLLKHPDGPKNMARIQLKSASDLQGREGREMSIKEKIDRKI
jgi:hypothetical protein